MQLKRGNYSIIFVVDDICSLKVFDGIFVISSNEQVNDFGAMLYRCMRSITFAGRQMASRKAMYHLAFVRDAKSAKQRMNIRIASSGAMARLAS